MRNHRGRIVTLAAFAALFLGSSLPLLAQERAGTTEITLFGGGSFGGRLYTESNQVFDRDVDVSDTGTYGARLGFNITRWLEFEAGFARAESHFRTIDRFGTDRLHARLGDLEERHWDGNFVFNFGHRRFQPYVTVGAGATELRTDVPTGTGVVNAGSDSNTRFSANLGGGMKMWVTPRFGFRFDARGRATYLGSGDCDAHDTFCDNRTYDSDRADRRRWYASSEVTGGVTFAF
jgi:hypothetical protein